MLPCKVDVDRFCEVGDLCSDHVGWKIGQELLATVLTFESSRIFCHFAAAILRHAGWVEDPVVVLNA